MTKGGGSKTALSSTIRGNDSREKKRPEPRASPGKGEQKRGTRAQFFLTFPIHGKTDYFNVFQEGVLEEHHNRCLELTGLKRKSTFSTVYETKKGLPPRGGVTLGREDMGRSQQPAKF